MFINAKDRHALDGMANYFFGAGSGAMLAESRLIHQFAIGFFGIGLLLSGAALLGHHRASREGALAPYERAPKTQELPKWPAYAVSLGLCGFGLWMISDWNTIGAANFGFGARVLHSLPFFVLGLGVLTTVLLQRRKVLIYRTRLAGGFCQACGYDLRESPERCPECGSVPHNPNANLESRILS